MHFLCFQIFSEFYIIICTHYCQILKMAVFTYSNTYFATDWNKQKDKSIADSVNITLLLIQLWLSTDTLLNIRIVSLLYLLELQNPLNQLLVSASGYIYYIILAANLTFHLSNIIESYVYKKCIIIISSTLLNTLQLLDVFNKFV